MIPNISLNVNDFEWNPVPGNLHAYGLAGMEINGRRFHVEAFHVKPAEGEDWSTRNLVVISPYLS